jgi:hypothetical protein
VSVGTRGPDRRRFLALIAGGGAALVAAGVGLRIGLDDGTEPAADSVPTPASPTPDAATAAIGERYLEETPTEASAADLRRLLPEELSDVSPGEQTDRVANAVRADFEQDRIVELDGWLLSVTECRLAALSVVS